MFVTVNGAKLYFDVEGLGLVPDGQRMREKPSLLMLHGGPGFDHSIYKPAFSQLSDIAQVIYLDHRGNGRSGGSDPTTWNLAQWGDDVKGFCDAVGIEKPIVYGASFGGFVAQAYATRHPDHPAKLVLANTAAHIDFTQIFAAFERVGGSAARDIAEAYWMAPTMERRLKYMEHCLPLYTVRRRENDDYKTRAIIKHDVGLHFNGPKNEQGRMDFRSALARVSCPTLVIGGDKDPIMPLVFSEEIARHLPPHLVRFERFENCGHGTALDQPERTFAVLRAFMLG
jgi:pimeloyl-ACP methyl ester carboxylesterase